MHFSARARKTNRSTRSNWARGAIRRAAFIEQLESRTLLSATIQPHGIAKAAPTISTTPSTTQITLGTTAPSLSDSADLENGSNPTGSINFSLTGPQFFNDNTEPVNGNGLYSSDSYDLATSGTVAGIYTWSVDYSGDEFNAQAFDTNEFVEVDKASPAIDTTPASTNVTLGPVNMPLQDSATLSGGYFESGNITFTLFDSTNTQVSTETVPVDGNGTYSTSLGFMPSAAGTYQWDATYNGDDNNNAISETNNSTEQVTVKAASPTLNTTPQPSSETLSFLNLPIKDSATLSDGYNETGSITFTLYDSTNTQVYSEAVPVLDDGTYTTPAGYTPTSAGTYQWDATYSGDNANKSVSETNNSNERVTVSAATPSLNTMPTPITCILDPGSTTLTDTANLGAGDDPTGSITFTLYDPGNNLVHTETVPVSGDGSYSTPTGYSVLANGAGTYQWDATYSGDSANNSVSDNDDASEQVKVSPPVGTNSISGTKFTDITGDGFTADDTGLGGVTIDLFFDGASTPTETAITANDGTYSFDNLADGSYIIQEEVPAGYTQTIGNSGYSAAFSGGSGSASNINFDDFKDISISGYTFTDIFGNGISGDDTGLAGVTVDLYQNGGTTPFASTMSAGDGSYSFTDLGPGTYVVKEEVPSGYEETDGVNSYSITATSGEVSTGNVFDNFEDVTVSGTKYKDHGDDGFSNDDTPLAGVTINLYSDETGTPDPTPLATAVTGTDGTYQFTDVGPGLYFVQETVPAGYIQTGGNAGYSFQTMSGTAVSGNDFDNYFIPLPAGSTISGKKYQDITGNGITSDDTGLGGVTIKLYKNGGTSPFATTTTAGNGTYSFTGLAAATYKVVEVVPSGWTQTAGSSGYTITASGTHSYTGKNFADFKNISISGTKFTDITGNGFSSDDTHLSGVKINLYKNGSSKAFETTTTSSNGSYSFSNLGPGSYKVQEVVPSGYVQTGGGPSGSTGNAYYTVSAHSGKNSTGENFDDYKIPICKPTKIYYTINHGSTKYTTLTGHTHKGDTVTVTFTVPAGMDDQLTLVSYSASSSKFDNSTASQQKIYQQATGTFAPGTHSLTIKIPNSYYQIDFICGPAISQLVPPNNGPDSINIAYGAEKRLLGSET